MVDEKKGHVKVTLDVEINAPLMDLMKECIDNMPQAIQMIAEHQKKKQD